MQDLTWERYIEIGEDVYQKLGIPMLTLDPTDSPLLRIIMQSGGHWYVDENNHADIEDNEYLKAGLHTYQQLLKRNVGVSVNGWNEFISAFQNYLSYSSQSVPHFRWMDDTPRNNQQS